MRSFAPGLKRLAAASLCAAAAASLCAADQTELPPSKRNAPKGQKLEFSAPAAGPQLPMPSNAKESLQERRAMVPETSGAPGVDAGLGPSAVPLPTPSKAFAEKMKQQWDKKKNWMMPGAQDDFLGMGDSWATKGFESTDNLDSEDKNKTLLERFLSGDSKPKANRPDKRKEDKDDPNSDNPDIGGKAADGVKNSESSDLKNQPNGVSDFNLKGFLSSSDRNDKTQKSDPNRAFQIRGEIGGDQNRSFRERERERERDRDAHAADFQQMIQPHTPGVRFGGIADPINAGPDLTRRDMNPIVPRAMPEIARPETSPFNPPALSSGPIVEDRAMFGVASPGISGLGSRPTVSVPQPSFRPAQSIILEPPKRKFN